ncbi:pentatricopeptide repeat-containing protein At1g62590-like [Cornus florida]|uniref:pentatricopeptide repeat-containing protein At1g62590-like n=1 Tax=Cornus florida TaxID=4283 RepID=UPI00289930EE|nr:pentatricopeptide repeat-containing protein At1g62590-like [Cornus florida]
MAVKLSSFLAFSRKIPRWVHFSAYASSVSCANNIEILPENDQNPLSSYEFETKIQFLRNKISADKLVQVLDSTDDLNSSLKLFKWASLQKGFRHTTNTYCKIILKLGMVGNVDEMEGFCNEMVKERCANTEEALVALIELFVKHHLLMEASRVLVVMNSSGYKASITVFNVLLGALVEEKKDFQAFLFVYKEMVKAGVVPTVETLNYLLEALFEAGRVDTALDQYRRMNKKGCVPNSKTFEILISGLITRNGMEESIVVLDNMLELGVEPDLSFYTGTIFLFCRENNLEQGMRLFRMMRASKMVPNSLIYGVLIRCLCENLHVVDAVKMFEETIDNSISPADDVCINIINGFCKLGKFDEATKFLEDKHVLETCPHNVLLEGYCNSGNFLMAKCLFDEMLERNIVDADSWNILIRCLSENTWIDKALEFLGRMIVSSYVPDSATYSAIIIGKCKLSRYEDALVLFHQVSAKYWLLDSVSYAELVQCLCQGEKIHEAVKVFSYMSNKRCALQSSSFSMLIRGLCEAGKVGRAIGMLSLAYYSGTSCSNATYNTIMLSLSKSKKADDLLIVLSRMVVEGCTLDSEAYCILIQCMSTLGQTKDCALFFNLMVNEGLLPNPEALTNLLLCMARHSQLHMILLAIDKLISSHEILNSAMYNLIINGLLKEGYKSKACQLLDLMLEKGWVPDAITHRLLIGSAVKEETDGEVAAHENLNMQEDKVCSILAESLGEM